MKIIRTIFSLHTQPTGWLKYLLAALPFVLLIAVYLYAADVRHEANPADKLLPTLGQMGDAIDRMAFTPSKRSGEYLLWNDTLSSLTRLGSGVLIAAISGLFIGLNMGVFPNIRAMGYPMLVFFSMIPPLAILPILFLLVGVDQAAKITLIVIGILPILTRDTLMAIDVKPQQQVTKALTLGATELAVAYRIILPQILPRLIESVRLALGAAWLFLIAAEAIAANEGLGYRIFLVRRYLAMDIIIPYVLWITAIGFTTDFILRMMTQYFFPWYKADKA